MATGCSGAIRGSAGPSSSLAGAASRPGLPVLAPEVQLLYKSGACRPQGGPRPKDEEDLDAILPTLEDESRAWLASALSLVAPDNQWLARLND